MKADRVRSVNGDPLAIKLEIAPEPSPAEREALERTLAQLEQRRNGASPAPERGAWWRSGLEQNVDSGHGPAAK